MKTSLLLVLLTTIFLPLFAQDNSTFKINSIDQATKLNNSGYLNPIFINGTIFFKGGALGEAKLNFNRYSNEVLFISPKGDTLSVAQPETVSYVQIGTDTLYFYQNLILLKITHNRIAPDLYAGQIVSYIGKEKKGAFGTYSATGSINSAPTVSTTGELTRHISTDENLIYKINTYYYLSDTLNNFYPAKKMKFAKIFPQYAKEINIFFKTHETDFNKKENLLQVINYLQGLNP
jgi:hypothetical protein